MGIQRMKESIPGKHTVPLLGRAGSMVKLDQKQALALRAPPPEAGGLLFSPHQAQSLSAKKNWDSLTTQSMEYSDATYSRATKNCYVPGRVQEVGAAPSKTDSSLCSGEARSSGGGNMESEPL